MANTLKKSAATLQEIAAGNKTEKQEEKNVSQISKASAPKHKRKTIMIGTHFDLAARRSLALVQADPRNEGKQINDLLAEALNDLFAKYNVPQTAMLG